MSLANKILVVCIGNICRSPAGEGFFISQFKKKEIKVEVGSAGIAAMVNQPAALHTQKIMREVYDIDVSQHRARQMTEQMARYYDLILVMDDEQETAVKKMFPFAAGKTQRMGRWRSVNIDDPYRQSEAVFQEKLAIIYDCVNDWMGRFW